MYNEYVRSLKVVSSTVLKQRGVKRLTSSILAEGVRKTQGSRGQPGCLRGAASDRNWFVSTSSSLEIQAFSKRVSAFINFSVEMQTSPSTYEAQSGGKRNRRDKLRGAEGTSQRALSDFPEEIHNSYLPRQKLLAGWPPCVSLHTGKESQDGAQSRSCFKRQPKSQILSLKTTYTAK